MESNEIIFPVNPFSKPRMTQSDKWKKRPVVVKYHIYKEALCHYANMFNYKVSEELSVTFVIKMADSWSKKKKAEFEGKPHRQTPDLDNLVKAFQDCLCTQDNFVHKFKEVNKIWGHEGRIIIRH